MDIDKLHPVQQIEAVENWIKSQPQIEIETCHHHAGGVYEREIIVPAGAVITGKIHLTEHLAKLVKGTMTIYSEHNRGTFTGPVTFISKPGEKRIGYAHDEVVFSTFHAIEEQDIDLIEKALVVDSMEQYLEHTQQRALS